MLYTAKVKSPGVYNRKKRYDEKFSHPYAVRVDEDDTWRQLGPDLSTLLRLVADAAENDCVLAGPIETIEISTDETKDYPKIDLKDLERAVNAELSRKPD